MRSYFEFICLYDCLCDRENYKFFSLCFVSFLCVDSSKQNFQSSIDLLAKFLTNKPPPPPVLFFSLHF